MIGRRLPSTRFLFLLVAVLCATVAAGVLGTGEARADLVGDGAACWVTGPLEGKEWDDQGEHQGKEGFGGEKEFILDRFDFWGMVGNEARALAPLDDNGVVSDKLEDWGYFGSFAEAVDFTFALNKADIDDAGGYGNRKLLDLQYLLTQGSRPGEPSAATGVPQIPYEKARSYAFRRAVASYYSGIVHSFSANWLDPYNPSGGKTSDLSALLGDTLGGQADITAATIHGVGTGDRLHTQEGIQRVTTIGGTVRFVCDQGHSCNMSNDMQSGQADANFRSTSVDQSNREVYLRDVDPDGVRTVDDVVGDEHVVDSQVQHVDLSEYRAPEAPYIGLFGLDSASDKIQVSIELDPTNRQDYEWKLLDDGGFAKVYMYSFGPEINRWTYDNYGNVAPVNEYSSVGVAGVSSRQVSGSGARVLDVRGGVDTHYGYRQPTMGSAYIVRNSDSGHNPEWHGASGYLDTDMDRERVFGVGGFPIHSSGERVVAAGAADILDAPAVYDNANHDLDRLRWPVNLEDMNWYLYDLPGESGADEWQRLSAFWLSPQGTTWLLGSGYGKSVTGYIDPDWSADGGPGDLPNCVFADPDPDDQQGPVPALGKVECEVETAGGVRDVASKAPSSEGDLVNGKLDRVYFPFEFPGALVTSPGPAYHTGRGQPGPLHHLNGTLEYYKWAQRGRSLDEFRVEQPYAPVMVRAGVVRPDDAQQPAPRKLNRFSFVINEELEIGDAALAKNSGTDVKRRYGVPLAEKHEIMYYDEWPNERIDPNRSYLMVATFYESLPTGGKDVREFKLKDSDLEVAGETVGDTVLRMPERHIRRVICRFVVHPMGFSPLSEEGEGWAERQWNKGTKFIGGAVNDLQASLLSFFGEITKSPGWVTKKSLEVTCDGVVAVDKLTGPVEDALQPLTFVNRTGALQNSPAALDRQQTLRDCSRASVPDSPTCRPGADLVVDGKCINLPEMKLTVNGAESSYLALNNVVQWPYPDSDSRYDASQDQYHFRAFPSLVGTGVPDWSPSNVGLSEIRLDFDFAWAGANTGLYGSVDGYAIEVTPDVKVAQILELPLVNGVLTYFLPKDILEMVRSPDWSADTPTPDNWLAVHLVDGFWVGGLNQQGAGDKALVKPSNYDPAAPLDRRVLRGMGGETLNWQQESFNYLLGRLPLAPGYVHKFRIAPYYRTLHENAFDRGEYSEYMELDGSKIACTALAGEPGGLHEPDGDERRAALIFLGCPDAPAPAQGGFTELDFRVGLLGLAGSEMCGDIFSSTPGRFTWDNSVVQRVWLLMWVIAGSVLFVLMVWQAFRMTFDLWLDPRPAVGLRELVPRFLVALALAAASLFLCKWILILCNDLTCFVAHATGMTMWGFVGNTFMSFAGGFFDVWWGWSSQRLHRTEDIIGLFLILGLVVLFLTFIVLIVFLKVAFEMIIRIVLLAALIAFAPLAFALYASENTAHWTKKWISMFFGTAFQQVIVLVVIYLGGHLIAVYATENDDSIFAFIIGMLMGILVLAAADRVPKLVNPVAQSANLFSGFGQLMAMGLAATAMVVTAGAGAVAGGVGGPGGAASAGGGAAMGGAGGGTASMGAAGSAAGTGGGGGTAALGSAGGGGAAPSGAMQGLGNVPSPATGGRMGNVMSGMGRGFQQGVRTARQFNTRTRDVTEGNFLYRNRSSSDDSAGAVQQLESTIRGMNRGGGRGRSRGG